METYGAVQQRLAYMREVLNTELYETRAFTRKIKCGECGRHYSRVRSKNTKKSGKTYINYYWTCSRRKEKGKAACPAERIPEKRLERLCCDVLGWDEFDVDDFREAVDKIVINGYALEFCFSDGSRKGMIYG